MAAKSRRELQSVRGFGNVNGFQYKNAELTARVSGFNPGTGQPDSDKRLSLFERIRNFYVLYTNCERIREGLGEIVEWAEKYGEHELNNKLKAEYKGLDLESADQTKDETLAYIRQASKLRIRGRTKSKTRSTKTEKPGSNDKTMTTKSKVKLEEGSTIIMPSEDTLRKHLTVFYERHDRSMLEPEKFERVLNYAKYKGVAKLNTKLQKKFGAGNCLNIAMEESEAEFDGSGAKESFSSSRVKRKDSFTTMLRETEQERQKERSKIATKNSQQSQNLSLSPISVSGSKRNLNFAADNQDGNDGRTRLPPQLKLFLKLYYACYDPIYILKDKLNGAKQHAEEVGLEEFDKALKTKYKESLSEFQGRVEIMQDKLQSFFLKEDMNKINNGFMEFLQWAMRNGKTLLNKELRNQYGQGLDSVSSNDGRKVVTERNVGDREAPKF